LPNFSDRWRVAVNVNGMVEFKKSSPFSVASGKHIRLNCFNRKHIWVNPLFSLSPAKRNSYLAACSSPIGHGWEQHDLREQH
jgi:hypothetical protein